MQKSRLQYLLTWLSLTLILMSSTLLMISAWNSLITGPLSPGLYLLLWIIICASGIFLFMLAVKKAHRLWVDEKRNMERLEKMEKNTSFKRSDALKENKALDFAASARRIVRRIPENIVEDQLGALLLQNIARELEIMSGVFFIEDEGVFRAVSTYAMSSPEEPRTFVSGEGLPGQVARNQQPMVLTRLPEAYLEVYSGLGKAVPAYLAIVPLVHKGRTIALLECSGYRYAPGDIENMFRILARELMDKRSPHLS